jgi:hypothetical protein
MAGDERAYAMGYPAARCGSGCGGRTGIMSFAEINETHQAIKTVLAPPFTKISETKLRQ